MAAAISSADAAQYGSMANANLGQGANLRNAIPFPADNPWNTDISQADVDPNSDNILATMSINSGLHPDFGAGTYAGSIMGIPYYVVPGTQPKVKIKYKAYPE